jgi:hypothetical protein
LQKFKLNLNFDGLAKSLKAFDWRSLQKYASPKASGDLNAFLEKLPQNTNQSMLVIAGVSWACAAAMGLYTTIQLQKLTELRGSLQEAEALKPIVPVVKDVPVNKEEVTDFVAKTEATYQGLSFKANGAAILIEAESTGQFGQFREAVGHVQNGGAGWKVNIDRLCVGRECGKKPLAAALKINKVSVDKPG